MSITQCYTLNCPECGHSWISAVGSIYNCTCGFSRNHAYQQRKNALRRKVYEKRGFRTPSPSGPGFTVSDGAPGQTESARDRRR